MFNPVGVAIKIIDDVRDAVAPPLLWPATGRLSDASFAGAQRRADLGRDVLRRIDAIDPKALPDMLSRTLRILRARAEYWIVQPEWYWTVFDPGGGEMFSMFAPTPYGGGGVLTAVPAALGRANLSSEAARARYLAGLHDLGDQLDVFAERTRGQAERQIFMPRPQAEAARQLLQRLTGSLPGSLSIGDGRLAGEGAFKREVEDVIGRRVAGGLARIADVLNEAYFGQTRERVGLMHYPDGAEIYSALVRLHGNTGLSPAEIHEFGLERVGAIRTGLAAARRDAGFDGDDRAYRAHLDADPEWRATTAQALSQVFERYIERLRPHLGSLFRQLPEADYGVRPLPDAVSSAMTFGFYDAPSPTKPRGEYVFNAQNLAMSNTSTLASLNYHELAPGHHLHLALQRENLGLPAILQWCMPTAYVEGWAEYAVTLTEELGMFEHPAERFGRYVNEAFLASRLVVDTGLNALGWSLEQARAYLAENCFLSMGEINSETLRYGADIPGQALAYKLGDRALVDMREEMRRRLGSRFDVRDFHDAVLGNGAMPIPILAEALEARIRELEAVG